MLVLSRNDGEVILVGEGDRAVRITLVRSGHGRARIGIEAPDDVRIDRLEVREVKQWGYNPPPAKGGQP